MWVLCGAYIINCPGLTHIDPICIVGKNMLVPYMGPMSLITRIKPTLIPYVLSGRTCGSHVGTISLIARIKPIMHCRDEHVGPMWGLYH